MTYDSQEITIQCVPQHVYSKLEKLADIRTNGDMNELLLQSLKDLIDRDCPRYLGIDSSFDNFRRKYPQNAFFSATDYDFYLVVDLDTKRAAFNGFPENENLPRCENVFYFKIDGNITGEEVFRCTRLKYIEDILYCILNGLFYCLDQQRARVAQYAVNYKEYEIACSCLLQDILNNFCEPQLLIYEDDIDAFLSRFSLEKHHVVYNGTDFFCNLSLLDQRQPPVDDIALQLDLLALKNGVYLNACRWKRPVDRLIARMSNRTLKGAR